MLFETLVISSEEVEVNHYPYLHDEMRQLGYHYFQIMMETPYTRSHALNVPVTIDNVTFKHYRTIKGNREGYKLNIDANGNEGSISVSDLKIIAIYKQWEDTLLITCAHNIYITISYQKEFHEHCDNDEAEVVCNY